MLLRFRIFAALAVLLLASEVGAHPFLDITPLPPTAVTSGAAYNPSLTLFPGDTAVESIQLDFELSSLTAFGVPAPVMGDGFSFVYDAVGDPLHFSIVGDFEGAPLEEFGEFPVALFSFVAGLPGGSLLLLDSSHIVALEDGEPIVFDDFSNVDPDNVVAHVVPEPGTALQLALGVAALAGLARARRR